MATSIPQWQQIRPDFSGSTRSMANAGQSASRVATIGGQMLDRERKAKLDKEAMDQRILAQSNVDRGFGLKEEAAKQQALQNEFNQGIANAKLVQSSDAADATATNRNLQLKNQALRDEATKDYRDRSISLQETKNLQDQARSKTNADMFKELSAIQGTTTVGESLGVNSNTAQAQSQIADAGNMPVEVQQAVLQEAQMRDSEVIPVDRAAAAQTILAGSDADVNTRVAFANMIKNQGKPKITDLQKELSKVGLKEGTAEAEKYMKDLAKKKTYISGNSYDSKGTADTVYNVLKNYIREDDIEGSKDSLISNIDVIESKAKVTYPNLSLKEAVKKYAQEHMLGSLGSENTSLDPNFFDTPLEDVIEEL